MSQSSEEILKAIAQAIFDKKGVNIIGLDVREVSSLTDYFLIAEGTVARHVKAIADAVLDKLEGLDEKPLRIEGSATADWLVIDLGDILIHLFIPELREKYTLEELWHKGKIVDLEIEVGL